MMPFPRILTRARVPILAALFLLAGTVVVVWEVAHWPPPRLILTYGLPPAGGPTGRTKVIEGIEFVELSPGYCRVEACGPQCIEGDLLGRWTGLLGLSYGSQPHHTRARCRYWFEAPSTIWVSGDQAFPHGRECIREATEGEAVYYCSTHAEDTLPFVDIYFGRSRQPVRCVMVDVWSPPEDE